MTRSFRRMTRICLFGSIVLAASVIVACSDLLTPTPNGMSVRGPRFTGGVGDCGGGGPIYPDWSESQCNDLLGSIYWLFQATSDYNCAELATDALNKFYNGKIYNGGGYVDSAWGGGVSGYGWGEIQLGNTIPFSGGQAGLADFIAHEVSHDRWNTRDVPEDSNPWSNARNVGLYCAGLRDFI